MNLNKTIIKFSFSEADKKLFEPVQKTHIKNIENNYTKLYLRCQNEIFIPTQVTHKEWVTSRVQLHANTSIMRLLYLTEAFCQSSKNFNSVAVASLIKSMTEIPLHIGYLIWVISENSDFEIIRRRLNDLAFGDRDQKTGLTYRSKIRGKELCEKTDLVVKKHFNRNEDFFKWLYQESNAIGHHNYEGREMLSGLMDKQGFWHAKDRKELFLFYSNKIFQFFFYCDSILGMTSILLNAMDHYLKQLPDYYKKQ